MSADVEAVERSGDLHEKRSARDRRWRALRRGTGTLIRGLVLSSFVYVFLFPFVFMLVTSVKTVTDLNNPTVKWISLNPTLANYELAMSVYGYVDALRINAFTSIPAAIGQTVIGAMVAYGFARLPVPGRGFWFGVLLFSIVVPLQTIMIPQFLMYNRLNWMNTYLPIVLPPWVGYGVRGGILLIVYRQFFRGLPYELEDAAYVDGAGPFRAFWQIMLPLAKPAILVVFLFSLVWTWNDTFMPSMVLRKLPLFTLSMRLIRFYEILRMQQEGTTYGDFMLLQNTFMAAVVLGIAPMLIMYVFAQRYFTQSIDRTGLVE